MWTSSWQDCSKSANFCGTFSLCPRAFPFCHFSLLLERLISLLCKNTKPLEELFKFVQFPLHSCTQRTKQCSPCYNTIQYKFYCQLPMGAFNSTCNQNKQKNTQELSHFVTIVTLYNKIVTL